MSANQDKSHGIRFVFANLYQIYSNKKSAAPVAKSSGIVLKAEDLKQRSETSPVLKQYQIPPIKNPLPQNSRIIEEKNERKKLSLQQLKTNLEILKQLQARLRLVLSDLENTLPRKYNT